MRVRISPCPLLIHQIRNQSGWKLIELNYSIDQLTQLISEFVIN